MPEKSINLDTRLMLFFNEINPFRICEIPFICEILFHNVKYACGRVELFHFIESVSFLFHNFNRNYFTSTKLIFHLWTRVNIYANLLHFAPLFYRYKSPGDFRYVSFELDIPDGSICCLTAMRFISYGVLSETKNISILRSKDIE